MGLGIAQAAIKSGYCVTVQDRTQAIIDRAQTKLQKNFEKLEAKGRQTGEETRAQLSRICFTTEMESVAQADLIIEAATENLEIKKQIFQNLDALAKPGAILASNTSSISITELGAATKRPQDVVGMHFFNPVAVMKLLEITKGYLTSKQTVDTALEIGAHLGKVTIVSMDKPGFIVNRILDPMLNEAIMLVEEGVGTPEDIDNGMKYGCNHPMGPLELTDLIGLDVILAVMEVLYREYGDPKYRPCLLLKRMVQAGKLGRKTGEGFYRYDQ